MQSLTRQPRKLRRVEHAHTEPQRSQSRPAPRRQSTRAAQIRAALKEG